MANDIVRYTADNGQEIEVTSQDIRDLLAAGGNSFGNITDQEIKAFIRLCQAQRLNPFTKDAYLVKYGDKPASVIAGKETFTKRAQRSPRFRGYTAGITVVSNGQVARREGSLLLPGEQLIGGWCSVVVEGYDAPIFDEVAFGEYNTGKSNWLKIPATMIRKVAICHALREAFPEDLGGLYGSEEMEQAELCAVEDVPAAPMAAQAPQPAAQAAQEPRQAPKPPDPRKHLWDRAGKLHAEAVALGVRPEGIDSWMAASILRPDGTPKPKPDYTDMDLYALCDYLEAIAKDARALKDQPVYEVPDAAEEIPF